MQHATHKVVNRDLNTMMHHVKTHNFAKKKDAPCRGTIRFRTDDETENRYAHATSIDSMERE
jgi:hypothetical protein